MPRTPFTYTRIKTKCHKTYRGSLPRREYRYLCSHTRLRCSLIPAAERKQYGRCANGTIETLCKSALRTTCKIRQISKPRIVYRPGSGFTAVGLCQFRSHRIKCFHKRGSVLCSRTFYNGFRFMMCSGGIEESTFYVDDCFSPPFHHKPVGSCYSGNNNSIQIFCSSAFYKRIGIILPYDDSHSFLRFRDSELRPI